MRSTTHDISKRMRSCMPRRCFQRIPNGQFSINMRTTPLKITLTIIKSQLAPSPSTIISPLTSFSCLQSILSLSLNQCSNTLVASRYTSLSYPLSFQLSLTYLLSTGQFCTFETQLSTGEYTNICNITDKEYTDNSVPAGSVHTCRKK